MSTPSAPEVPPHRSAPSRRPGATWVALAVLLLFLVLFGVAPLYAYVAARNLPSGVRTEQATVVRTDGRLHNGHDYGNRGVTFRLPGGTEGFFVARSRFLAPQPGDPVTVYRRHGAWHSPSEYGVATLLQGIGAVVVFGGLVLVWLRMRLRGRGDSAGDTVAPLPGRR